MRVNFRNGILAWRFLCCIGMGAVLILGPSSGRAAAYDCPSGMSILDCQSNINEWTAWKPDVCGGGNSSGSPALTTRLTGSDNISKTMNFLTGKGLTVDQAAAIVGNLEQESGAGIIPSAVNASSGAYGIAQWLNDRKDRLMERDPHDTLESQLDYFWWEVTETSERRSLQVLKAGGTLEQMTEDWARNFERPGEHEINVPQRVKYARDARNLDGVTATLTASGRGGAGCATPGFAYGSGCAGGDGKGLFVDGTDVIGPVTPTAGNVREGLEKLDDVKDDISNLDKYFKDGKLTVAGMCARARQIVDPRSDLFQQWCVGHPASTDPSLPCRPGWCDFTASFIWGQVGSGHHLAANWKRPADSIPGVQWHWNDLLSRGVGHPNDRHPPVGALLFYDNSHWGGIDSESGLPSGHVAVYLGGNTVIASDADHLGTGKFELGYVGILSAADMEAGEQMQKYLGWAMPEF